MGRCLADRFDGDVECKRGNCDECTFYESGESMTIREVIDILIDAPDKDKPFIVECRKDVLKGHRFEYGQLEITQVLNCGYASIAQARKQSER